MQKKLNILAFFIMLIMLILFKSYTDNVNNTMFEMNKKIENFELQKDTLQNTVDSLRNEIQKYSRIKLSKMTRVEIPRTFSNDKLKVLIDACNKYNVPPKIVCRLIYAESTFRENVVSYAGAKGYMQIMPNTIKHIEKTTDLESDDPYWNLKMGTYYISYLYDMFKGYNKHTRWRLTILSYNIGPGRVKSDPMHYLNEYKDYSYLNKILGNRKLGNI